MKFLLPLLVGCCFLAASAHIEQKKTLAKGVKQPFEIAVEIAEPTPSVLVYDLPIASLTGVAITQGPQNLNPGTSHGYLNCLYAIDFASDRQPIDSVPGKILAAREGRVVALNDQGTASGANYNVDASGEGFGNWVAIQHEFNEVSFYAHLNEIKVRVGDLVERGQEIGIEGSTGRAGWRHLHFSVHRCIGDAKAPPYYSSQYECIPYKLQYLDKTIQVVDIRDFSELNNLTSAENKLTLLPVSCYQHPLLDLLKGMYKEDQDPTWQWVKASKEEQEELGDVAMAIRRKQHAQLKELIERHGWPGFETVGIEGSEALWLLVQHQDEDLVFQKSCLKLLKAAVDRGQANYKNYAYLLDRTRMNEQLPQVYGTQWIVEKGHLSMYQVENEKELPKRRAAAGLPSIAEYKELLKEAYSFTDEDVENSDGI